MKNRTPELLAPAGNLTCALTAFENGADAVYLGLPHFNARERADNFSMEDLSKIIAFARKNDKKIYVTLNTLIKENEIVDIVEYLSELNYLKPDAIIVQDLGVVHLIKTYFPELTIHASTQMALHNSAGLKMIEDLGITRVILERQVTIKEVEEIQKKTDLEIEIFAHGALCSSLSTTCLFSSWIGGWSGNRGKCKQACRRRFFSEKEGNGFFFSTQDLYTIEEIEKFKDMGIASLKIEGRVKNQDYLKNTVSAYRFMIDVLEAKKADKVDINEAKNILRKSLGRKWSKGFLTEKSLNSVIQFESMGVSGLLVGKVDQVGHRGFTMTASRRLHIGDKIRVQDRKGDDGPAFTITKISRRNKPLFKLVKGDQGFIHCDKEFPDDGLIFKIGETDTDMTSKISKLPLAKPAINVDITIDKNSISANFANFEWSKEIEFQDAQKHSVTEDAIIKEFRISKDAVFEIGKLNIDINQGEKGLFIPSSVIRELRKEFISFAKEKIDIHTLKKSSYDGLEKFRIDYENLRYAEINQKRNAVVAIRSTNPLPKKKSFIAHNLFDAKKKADEIIMPFFCPENQLDKVKRKVKELYKECGIRRFRVTSIYCFEILKEYKDIHITVAFPFPVCNSMTVQLIKDWNVSVVQGWIELEREGYENLIEKSELPVEIYRYGRPILLATRAKVAVDGVIKDSRGLAFKVVKDEKNKLTYIYPEKVLSIPRLDNSYDFYDTTNAKWGEKETSAFNFDYSLF